MSRDPNDILRDALQLSPEARAALADSLLESLDSETDPEAESEWRREIRRRIADLDSGVVAAVPWSEARSRLLTKLRDDQ